MPSIGELDHSLEQLLSVAPPSAPNASTRGGAGGGGTRFPPHRWALPPAPIAALVDQLPLPQAAQHNPQLEQARERLFARWIKQEHPRLLAAGGEGLVVGPVPAAGPLAACWSLPPMAP